MLEYKLITLYFHLCQLYDKELKWHCQRFTKNQAAPLFSDCELLTCYLFAVHEEGKRRVSEVHEYILKYWHSWFPQLPKYKAFNNRLNQLSGLFPKIVAYLLTACPPEGIDEQISLTDSLPIMTCSGKRRGKVALESCDRGYCSVKGIHYWGVKLHNIGFRRPGTMPWPEFLMLSPASMHDLEAQRQLLGQLANRAVFGDKAFSDKELKSKLMQHNDCELLTPVKLIPGQGPLIRHWNKAADDLFSAAVSKIRQPVESFFNWLIEKVDIQNASKVRSRQGLIVHTFGKIAAALLNWFF